MKARPSLSDFSLFRSSPGLSEFEALLDMLPQAAFVIDVKNFSIILVNARATELTAFTRQELNDKRVSHVLPGFDKNTLRGVASDRSREMDVQVKQRNGKTIATRTTLNPLDAQGQWLLMTLEPAGKPHGAKIAPKLISFPWEPIGTLVNAIWQANLVDSLRTILQAGQHELGSSQLTIYVLEKGKESLTRLATIGSGVEFPQTLALEHVQGLSRPTLWEEGQKATSLFHRFGIAKKIRYLATAPLDGNAPLNGLVVASDPTKVPPPEILAFLQIMAASASAAIHTHSQISPERPEPKTFEYSATLMNTLKENVKDGIILVSSRLVIEDINSSAQQILGYAASEVLGKSIESVLISPKPLTPALKAAQQGSGTTGLGDLTLHRRDGTAVLAEVRIEPVMDGSEVSAIAVFITDLSKDEENRLRTQQLEQRAELGEVTAIFAHEVRNPINNISTGLQLMAMQFPEGDPNREQIDRFLQDFDRLEHMMKAVLTFAGPREYNMVAVDLGDLLDRLLERWRPRLLNNNIQYQVYHQPGIPTVLGDPRALEQVFSNLINNAVEAMSEKGGSLAVKIQPSDSAINGAGCVEITVSDNGPGIPKAHLDMIFKPFFTANKRGTGLGLAISERIVTAHKGQIRVESVPGGTVFIIKLPCAKEPAEED